MTPKARKLILDMLLAAEGMGQPLSVRDAIAAGALFRISENNVRVALVRLSTEGLIESAGRGVYALSGKARELAADVATWRDAERRVRPWQGGWLAVHSGPLGRSDRAALRRRTRALLMLGFRELDPGLHVRPDNVDRDAEAVRTRLYTLGLEREAAVFVASGFDAARDARIRRLWDGRALTATYRKLRRQLEDWLARSDDLEPEVAARESFLIGGNAIHHVVFDPLLPSPLVDAEARHAFIQAVRRFDEEGKAIWRRWYASQAALPLAGATEAARRAH